MKKKSLIKNFDLIDQQSPIVSLSEAPKWTVESYLDLATSNLKPGMTLKEVNPRKWVVREQSDHGRYHRDIAVFRITNERKIKIDAVMATIAPLTPEMEESINDDLKTRTDLPTSRPASVDDLKKLEQKIKGIKNRWHKLILYPFFDETGEKIVFVQERVYDEETREKNDIPWSLWGDAWHIREPDVELLPLWGLDQLQLVKTGMVKRIFLHEGAKTAAFVSCVGDEGDIDDMLSPFPHNEEARKEIKRNLLEHPWSEELKKAVHLGWPGGAPNAHRVDFSPIKNIAPDVEVIVVADNDPAGKNAVPKISERLQRPLKMLQFDTLFPRAFDLAEPFPQSMFQEKNGQVKFIGPKFKQLIQPATWATAGKHLREPFTAEWTSVVKPPVFIHKSNLATYYTEQEFNSLVAPFAGTDNVAKLLRRELSAQAKLLIYSPADKTGLVTWRDNGLCFNNYEPTKIAPVKCTEADVQRFLDYITYLFPEKNDQEVVLRWIATFVARPGLKIGWGLFVASDTQGVGKSMLGEKILAPLIGEQNCSYPDPLVIVDGKYTGWAAYKRLAIVEEVKEQHGVNLYNKSKKYFTTDMIHVSIKYVPDYYVPNHINFYMTSNHPGSLKVPETDRRIFEPEVTERKEPRQYFVDLLNWLQNEDGLGKILYWAQTRDEEYYFQQGEHAPLSERKQQSIEDRRSPGDLLVLAMLQELKDYKKDGLFRLDNLRDELQSRKARVDHILYGQDGTKLLETAERISSLARNVVGLEVPRKRFRLPVEEGGKKVKVISNFPISDDTAWSDIKGSLRTPGKEWL